MATRKRFIFSAILLIVFLIPGCSGRGPSEEVVARINDYEMTVEDFQTESGEIIKGGRVVGGIPIIKEDILDALITKQLILQEAQRRGLDKEKDFMETIELYWEQTLIKNLLKERFAKIVKDITVSEEEIRAYYEKMKRDIKAKVIICGEKRAAEELLKFKGDALERARGNPDRFSLLYTLPSRVYNMREDVSRLEECIFNIPEGIDREVVEINNRWGLILIEERIPFEPAPLSDLREAIVKLIRNDKSRETMDLWIEKLRSEARVKINKRILSELD